jgi:hypothetical protein
MTDITPNKIFDARGNLIWQNGLGAVSAQTAQSIQRATALVNQSSSLASQLKDSKPNETPNNVGKAANSIATAAGNIAGVALLIPAPAGPVIAIVAGAVAAVAGLISAIWGSDADEATYAQAAQITAENTKIERENYQLDQKRDALVSSIQNAMPLIRQFAKQENIDLNTATLTGLMGLQNGLGAATAQQQLTSAQGLNEFLKAQQNKRILDIAELTKSFEAVADTLVARQKQLQLMNTLQTYGSYGAGAVGLGALVYGGLKLAKGETKTGAISAGSGIALAALAYWLYTQSQKTEVLSQQGQQVLQTASQTINATSRSKYPTKEQLTQALREAGQTNDLAAIAATYNAETGSWTKGDFVGQVINSEPIKIKSCKGSECYYGADTKYFLSRNRGVNGLRGLRGYAEEMKGLPASYLLR